MNRKNWENYITENYHEQAEYLWTKFPTYAVFRHSNNKKWFALIAEIPKQKLIENAEGTAEILNIKCDQALIGSLREEQGFFPAYHMNKASWITVLLDGSVDAEQIKWLLDMSYDLTAVKIN